MATLFRTGDGSVESKIIVALELVDNDWFRRNFIHALELMCEQFNWEKVGTATDDFARDKSNEMLESVVFDVDLIPVGTIAMWGTDTPPAKWLMCDGAAISRTTYARLWNVIGFNFGAGDGSTTFNLPNFLERSPMGVKASGVVPSLGSTAGEKTHTQSISEMPSHDHPPLSPLTNFVGARSGGNLIVSNGSTVGVATATGTRGGGNPFNVVHPVLGVVFMIYAGE